jgi:hypothetical protein
VAAVVLTAVAALVGSLGVVVAMWMATREGAPCFLCSIHSTQHDVPCSSLHGSGSVREWVF